MPGSTPRTRSSSPPMMACTPSTSWSTALPMSWSMPASRARSWGAPSRRQGRRRDARSPRSGGARSARTRSGGAACRPARRARDGPRSASARARARRSRPRGAGWCVVPAGSPGAPRLPGCGGRRLESGLARDLAPDRIHGPERRLLLLGVDAELRTGLLRDHRQRREHALPGMVVESLEREWRHPRRTVHMDASWRSTA